MRLDRRWVLGLISLALALGGSGGVAAAPALADTTINVNTTADESTPGDGTCSLREALAFGDGTAEPDCAPGSPSGTTTINVPASSSHYFLTVGELLAAGSVVIKGGGVGALGTTIDAAHGSRALQVDSGATLSISGLTVTNGQAPACGANCPSENGGGIANLGALTLTDVTVSNNAAGGGAVGGARSGNVCGGTGGTGGVGGGIYNAGTLTLTDVTVTGNTAGGGGAGGNNPTGVCGGIGGFGGSGGGIFNSGTLTASSSTISDNASGDGGNPGTGTASGCSEFGGNGGNGGGIYNAGTASLTATTLSGNSTGAGSCGGSGGTGGAIASFPGTLTVAGSTISANHAGAGGASNGPLAEFARPAGGGGAGGGIDSAAPLSVLNSTIAFNTAGAGGRGSGVSGGSGGAGGAIRQNGSSATLTNVTISDNAAGNAGAGSPNGGVGAGSGIAVTGGSLTEANTIVGPDGCAGPVTDGGFNLLWAGFGCPGRFANPDLGPLASNGGSTQTLALGSGSAATDQVPANPLNCPATDQRGFIRPDGESTCDIGAYESGASPHISFCCFTAGLTLAPRFFGLTVRGAEKRGATVIAVLHKPRALVLLVRRIGRHHRLILVGLVRLGHHPAGRSLIHWNLRVDRRLLARGRYQVIMYALDGNVLSLPAKPGIRTLTVLADGKVRS